MPSQTVATCSSSHSSVFSASGSCAFDWFSQFKKASQLVFLQSAINKTYIQKVYICLHNPLFKTTGYVVLFSIDGMGLNEMRHVPSLLYIARYKLCVAYFY